VYINSEGQQKEVMKDVACMEAEKGGYAVIDLFGHKKFVKGKIISLDLIDKHTVLLQEERQYK
jgi:predicted RNA-binding protein